MTNKAVEWLLFQESKEGWQGDVRATCYATQALLACGLSPHETSVQVACNYLCAGQDPSKGTWSHNDGETAEALRTLILCGKNVQDKVIIEGLKGLYSLKASGKCIVRSDVGWVHPNLVARAFIALKQDVTQLLDPLVSFLTGDVGYDVKYTSRAVLVYKEAKRDSSSLKKADNFLRESVNNISSLSGEYIGYLIQALVALGYTMETGMIQNILRYLGTGQKENGSWENNVKTTAQIIIGLSDLGFRYKKPSLLSKKNTIRSIILAAVIFVAIPVSLSNLQPIITLIINIVQIVIGLVVVIEWLFPKIKLRV